MGYHKTKISQGEYGKFSKVVEEFEELQDAKNQNCKILELVELSDLYGAIEAYVKNKYNMNMSDIKQMSDLTKQSFKDGDRT
jgi:hypothetical protein